MRVGEKSTVPVPSFGTEKSVPLKKRSFHEKVLVSDSLQKSARFKNANEQHVTCSSMHDTLASSRDTHGS